MSLIPTLPTNILRFLVAFMRDPRTLVNFALTCKTTLAAVRNLPDIASLLLHGAAVFRDEPFPIMRALAILVWRRCELCGEGNVKGAKPLPFRLHAHDACIAGKLVNAYYVAEDTLQKLVAADAVYVKKDGYNPRSYKDYRYYTMKMYWEEPHALISPQDTVDCMEALSLEQAVAFGAARKLQQQQALAEKQAYAGRIARLKTYDEQVAAAAVAAKTARSTARAAQRLAELSVAMAAAGLGSIRSMCDKYGERALYADTCIGAYLRAQVRAPYKQDEAIRRLQEFVASRVVEPPPVIPQPAPAIPQPDPVIPQAASDQCVSCTRYAARKCAQHKCGVCCHCTKHLCRRGKK